METMPISKFKATCLAVVKRVKRTGKPIRITKFGEPVADVVPPVQETMAKKNWLGSMASSLVFMGDIVSPASDENDWEALRD